MPHDREASVKGRKIRLRVYMQAGTVRMKESHRPLTTARLQALRRVGTLLRKQKQREGCPNSPTADEVQIASTPHPIVFSKAGKTILDPSMRTVH